MKRIAYPCLVCLCLVAILSGCSTPEASPPSSIPEGEDSQAPTPSFTPEPTSSPTQEILYTPTLRYTPDSQMEANLQGVEDLILTHGIIFQFSPSASFADACPGYYMAVAPYRTTRSVFSFVLFRAPRLPDGEIVRDELNDQWNWLWEGIFPYEYGLIRSLDVIEGWPLMLQWVARWPNAGWTTGMAYGECPGDDFAMIALFDIQDPDDFELRVSRFEDQAPFDFWLQEGTSLTRYHYADYEAESLWVLDETPGKLVAVYWDENSPDFNDDGQPDLVIVWSIEGTDTPYGYLFEEDGFSEYGVVKYP
jgi:hypothetical protein